MDGKFTCHAKIRPPIPTDVSIYFCFTPGQLGKEITASKLYLRARIHPAAAHDGRQRESKPRTRGLFPPRDRNEQSSGDVVGKVHEKLWDECSRPLGSEGNGYSVDGMFVERIQECGKGSKLRCVMGDGGDGGMVWSTPRLIDNQRQQSDS